ncbi:MAG: 16S rRNA (guanine(966)-N(2))-methyltransferase RsmD [Deltaproteobacteria bacterium CG11_big_fil_rev_8_21_14_0_20_45_16]|nr:MAG: 16S rRNA (guanine(966)-N(2))-methyltransferase RsmD [Deltaproteobacteria bacterium CG11_big_fil_rev_8_21_14_0_20_45_16]
MKIIAGKWGGRELPRRVNPKMRPTSDKVREAIFGILEARKPAEWEKTRVLDLFSGTGALGFEALSRGAGFVSFVDNHLKTTKEIQKSLQEFEQSDNAEVICKGALDAITWLNKQGREFDLIILDPPYREDWVLATLNRLHTEPILASRGLVVAEHDKRESLSRVEGFWTLLNSRRYGDTCISFFCPKRSESFWKNYFPEER